MAESSQKGKLSVRLDRTRSETGNNDVHLYVEDEKDLSILAVVGTEQRKMSYKVTNEFMTYFGLDKSQYPAKSWKSDSEPHDWLIKFVSDGRCGGHRMQSARETLLDAKAKTAGKENFEGEDAKSIDDSSLRDIDNKGPRHYVFRKNGVEISAGSFIYVLLTDTSDSVAYIESLSEKEQTMRVRWLHKKEELKIDIPPPLPHRKEVFMSDQRQDLHLASFNAVATVLSWDHYREFKQWDLRVPHQPTEAHVCRRSVDGHAAIKTYNIEELRGYWDQQILSIVGINKDDKASVIKMGSRKQSGRSISGKIIQSSHDEAGDWTDSSRKTRSMSKSDFGIDTEVEVLCEGTPGGCWLKKGQRTQSRRSISGKMIRSIRDEAGDGTDSSRKTCSMSKTDFGIDTKVEVLCEGTPGLRGCWFICHVLEKNSDKLKLKCLEGKAKKKLEGWHSSLGTVAAFEELRVSGRTTIRPPPPKVEVSPAAQESGTAVDVWYSDCWLEGVLKQCDWSKEAAQVFIPETKKIDTFPISHLRISMDWVNGQWIAPPRANLDDITAEHQSSKSDENITETEVTEVENVVDYSTIKDRILNRKREWIAPPRANRDDITVEHQSSKSDENITETEVIEVENVVDYSTIKDRVLNRKRK